jgi:ABC-type Zn uptake system ZnuABC Zn-binding protein ZnuA
VQVVTTLPLFADFVRQVGGDRVEVTSLVPAGADPHTFEPSPSDVKKVAQADIAFANGSNLEPAAIGLIEANLPGDARLVVLTVEAISVIGARVKDPHVWMDPLGGKLYAELIRDALKRVDADGTDLYDANTHEYLSALTDLADEISRTIDSVPAGNRKLVVTHGAFGRFAEAFDLKIVAMVAPSPGQEPSPEDVANLTRAIEDQGVPAVFREPQVDAEGRILEQAAKDAGVEVCTLYSDSLDDRVTSYIEMMRFNAAEIARCLGGDSGG